MDRWIPPFLGRRRGWMLLCQLGLLLRYRYPGQLRTGPLHLAGCLAGSRGGVFSASQDVALDAYRREILPDEELGLGSAIHVQAYRISSLVPGSLSLILADSLPWSSVFWITGAFMAIAVVMTLVVTEPRSELPTGTGLRARRWSHRFPSTWDAAAGRACCWCWASCFSTRSATTWPRPGDALYLDMGFSKTQIGLVAKHAALWPAIFGGLAGGLLMIKIGINRAPVAVRGGAGGKYPRFLRYWPATALCCGCWRRSSASNTWGWAWVPPPLPRSSPGDQQTYAATQFALFTALAALPRTFANASTGMIVEQVGWVGFFLLCAILAIPGMLLLLWVAPWSGKMAPYRPICR